MAMHMALLMHPAFAASIPIRPVLCRQLVCVGVPVAQSQNARLLHEATIVRFWAGASDQGLQVVENTVPVRSPRLNGMGRWTANPIPKNKLAFKNRQNHTKGCCLPYASPKAE